MINTLMSYLFSFRFINFLWMGFCAWYAFKKWVLPGLFNAVIEQKNTIAIIRSSVERAQSEQKSIADVIEAQDKKGKELFVKIALWNLAITSKDSFNQQQQRATIYNYQQYRTMQYRAVQLLYAKRCVEQEVWDATLQDLAAKYGNNAAQQLFFQQVLGQVHKELQ